MLEKVRWIDLPSHKDERGVLTSIESARDIPFAIKRIFYIHDIVADRGCHTHLETDQVIIAVSGSFKLKLSNGIAWQSYQILDATKGLYIPKMIFIEVRDCSPDAVCLVLANTHYNINKTIRGWREYLEFIKNLKE